MAMGTTTSAKQLPTIIPTRDPWDSPLLPSAWDSGALIVGVAAAEDLHEDLKTKGENVMIFAAVVVVLVVEAGRVMTLLGTRVGVRVTVGLREELGASYSGMMGEGPY
jgi:hypothetical protein